MTEFEAILTIVQGRSGGLKRRIRVAEDHLFAHQIVALRNHYGRTTTPERALLCVGVLLASRKDADEDVL